ncbi:MAG: putative Sugar or nucleoside kinase, ribokinase family [Promethearchaeota archaeon]|nr:MAG: putative Sugar or nucleoside kinase, ribokinase family [Candidatus Lokiarchaeota archaeon]
MVYQKLNEYDVTLETFHSLNSKLKRFKDKINSKKCFLGFDGYIDSLYSLVKSRTSLNKWKRMENLSTFGNYISNIAGSSGNIERILKRKTSGGFAVNTSKALSALDVKINLVAAMGFPKIKEVFRPLLSNKTINFISFSNPGETVGLEFDDGKLLLPDFSNIMNISWRLLMKRVGTENLISFIYDSELMGFGHWAPLPHMDDIWQHLLDDIFPSIENLNHKLFFVDLADIKKRSAENILTMLKLLRKINDQIPVLLSLNDQEAIDITKALNRVKWINSTDNEYKDFTDTGKKINQEINLSYLVIHSPHFATISLQDGNHYWITEGFTSQPKYTTGAGEYFHSGATIALSCGMSPAESLLFGNALTAIFVRSGKAPDFTQLVQFIMNYMKYIEKDLSKFPL